MMIHWPAILACGEEQGYAWVAGPDDVEAQRPVPGDRLFDSQGHQHLLSQAASGALYWQPDLRLISPAELNAGLRAYAASLGICCTSKLVVHTMAEAISLVAWLERQ
ncbi:MAG: DUF4144 family protein [Oceanisphaera sp.]|nr:hypothetical protein [Gammaproteobacteria bacterium]MDX1267449.1 DUF4144 family protein [Oceanisphaera sp.]